MKLRNLRPDTRCTRLALAVCGGALLVSAGWLLRDRSATKTLDRTGPLDPARLPQDPKRLYEGHKSAVRSSLVEALALENDVPFARRTDLLRSTGGGLAETEIDLLVASLLAEKPLGEEASAYSTRFNETANLLHRQPAARERLARALASVANDPARDATLRDYALQHLRLVWNDSADDAGLRDLIGESLRRLARADQAVSTSALLSLHLLGDNASAPFQPVTRALADGEVASLTEALLEGPAGSRMTVARMTAARIAADRRLTALRPALARVASDPAEHMLARISAINAIGRIGDPADRRLLEAISSNEPSLAAATRTALESIP